MEILLRIWFESIDLLSHALPQKGLDKAAVSQYTIAVSFLQLHTDAQQTSDMTNQSVMQFLDKGDLIYLHA